MVHQSKILILIITALLLAGTAQADCHRGKTLYKAAAQAKDLSKKIRLLKQSTTACPDFNAFYELGKAHMMDHNPNSAEAAFKEAADIADGDRAQARALAALGQVYLATHRENDAILFLRKSYERHPYPKVLAKLKQLEMKTIQDGMSAERIKRALTSTASRAAFGVEPSINIRVNFRYNSSELDTAGRRQVAELGRALTDPAFAQDVVTLIGHTDKRGSGSYNQNLSEQRADSVKRYLVEYIGMASNRIRTEGQGEQQLLYDAESEADHALNRRVEVRLDR